MIDFTKPVQTSDGRAVRILCTDANCSSNGEAQPIVGLVGDHYCPMAWCLDGRYYGASTETSDLDLVNVPPPKKKAQVEVRLLRDHRGVYASAYMHDPALAPSWTGNFIAVTTIEIEYEDKP